ncbi:MAG: Fic family protein [Proteobacteria bacterium]|nr:Fic family protein [Pseudomonadota bacterium]
MSFDPEKPYNDLPYLPPKAEIETKAVLTKLVAASQFLAELRGYAELLPDKAIIHYQFESIHPFYDGNGRTGRIINVLYLVMKGLLSEPLLYLSRYIIQHKADYYRLLRKVTTENSWEEWICFMLTAVEKTACFTLGLSKEIVTPMENVRKSIQNKLPKVYSHELVEILFTNVYTRIDHLVGKNIASRNVAGRYLNQLESINILKKEKVGRDVFYINTALYDLFKTFSDMH